MIFCNVYLDAAGANQALLAKSAAAAAAKTGECFALFILMLACFKAFKLN